MKWSVEQAVAGARAAGPVEFSFKKQSDWGQGFVGEVSLVNHSTDDVKDWRVRFKLPQNIQGLWGAKILKHAGAVATLGAEHGGKPLDVFPPPASP